jgi:5-(carboxyamino)imidazole ribonucleotide mutase
MNRKVAILMGSDSDLPVAKKTFEKLRSFGIEYQTYILSAHRTPALVAEFAAAARETGYAVIIAIAGMSAALAGAVAAHTTLPVIGVPCRGGALDGLDALLATAQMPEGVPVATLAIDGGGNAAILAAEILGVYDETIAEKLAEFKAGMVNVVIEKNNAVQQYRHPVATG